MCSSDLKALNPTVHNSTITKGVTMKIEKPEVRVEVELWQLTNGNNKELGIELEEEEEIIIRRKLSSKNRSQFWLNDQAITMSSVRKLSLHLIDILGQHENQGLLNESKHVDYLDQAHPVVRERISYKYNVVISKYNLILSQVSDFASKLRDLD